MNILKSIIQIKSYTRKIDEIYTQLLTLNSTLSKLQESLGRIESRQIQKLGRDTLSEREFQVYSQWGEDGIIDFLVENTHIDQKVFVEFGVQDYRESNTRFLLINRNWSGLVMDGSEEYINYIKRDFIYWKYNLKAECAFITKENINSLLLNNGISGEIGLLSIDIDGNDYWVWDAIEVINPAIVVSEYNARFGKEKALTIPYEPNFYRSQAHYSNIYYGASLKALYLLAQRKGYAFVGCNSTGNNAFFVRRDLKSQKIKELGLEEGFVDCQFRESRDIEGNLAYLDRQQEKKILATLPLETVEETNV